MKQLRRVVTAMDRSIRTSEIANEEREEEQALERANRNQDFVQFPRESMRAFVGLIRRSPAAAQILLQMAAHMSRMNNVGAPSKAICEACGISRATFSRAVKLLKAESWITPVDVGGSGTYKVNAKAFWSTGRTFKHASDVFVASLPAAHTRAGKPVMQPVKARLIPTISTKPSKRNNQKGDA